MIWVLTSEPYHDNSCVLGAYTDLRTAVAALMDSIKVARDDDLRLTSCNAETGERITHVDWFKHDGRIGYYRYHPHRFTEVDPMTFDWAKDPE